MNISNINQDLQDVSGYITTIYICFNAIQKWLKKPEEKSWMKSCHKMRENGRLSIFISTVQGIGWIIGSNLRPADLRLGLRAAEVMLRQKTIFRSYYQSFWSIITDICRQINHLPTQGQINSLFYFIRVDFSFRCWCRCYSRPRHQTISSKCASVSPDFGVLMRAWCAEPESGHDALCWRGAWRQSPGLDGRFDNCPATHVFQSRALFHFPPKTRDVLVFSALFLLRENWREGRSRKKKRVAQSF